MLKDFKLGIRLLKYAHSARMTMIIAGVMVLFGILITPLNLINREASLPGGYFIMLSVLFLIQLISSVSIAKLAQVSPAKKRLQTSVPTMLNLVFMSSGFFLSAVVEYICILLWPEETQLIAGRLLFTAVIMGVVILYSAVAYKLFFLGTVFFLVIFFTCYVFLSDGGWTVRLWESSGLFWQVVLIGFAIIALCCLLQYGISLALYRLPMSKYAQSATLRKQL